MDPTDNEANRLLDAILNGLTTMVDYLPSILTIIAILALGWIVARLGRRFARKIGTASNQWLMRIFPSGLFSGARMSSLAVALLGELVFWATLLVAVTMAARFAELGSISQWLEQVTAQLPNLIAGIGIVVVGYFLSVFAREQLLTQTSVEQTTTPLVGSIAQAVVMSIALIIGLDQVGIDVALLIGLAVVITAGILTAVAVAFASGARSHISNLVGARAARANLSVGMTIQLGDLQGEIVELTSALIALDTDSGRVLVPGQLIDESVITVMNSIVSEEDGND